MSNFVKVARVEDIPEGEMKSVVAEHQNILLVHVADGIFALADECTHDYAPLSTGRVKGNQVMCSRHGARFDVKSGAVLAPPAIVDVDTFAVKVEDGDIYVAID